MIPKQLNVLGLKDMSEMQMEALTKVLGHALILAEASGDTDIAEEVYADANELIELLGGSGVTVNRTVVLQF